MMPHKHKYPYNWTLKDARFSKGKGKGKVFSCFACGGGSTMGYKLAGFDVIGCNEIDPRMMKIYRENHAPKFSYLESIQTFKTREDLPPELYALDILDGSPPCSSFSVAGARERDWGKEKHFREGQAKQVLDTLFFDFIDLAQKLQPKVVIAENVKGLLIGEAKDYVRRIHEAFDHAGYYVQHFLLDASKMGVPQKRERVFFICLRKDLARPFLTRVDLFHELPKIDLTFHEAPIPLKEVADYQGDELKQGTKMRTLWEHREWGDLTQAKANLRLYGKASQFNQGYAYPDKVCYTLTSKKCSIIHYEQPRFLSHAEQLKISTFPSDYNFLNQSPYYICGMSVPPVMTAQIATRIYEQWLSKL